MRDDVATWLYVPADRLPQLLTKAAGSADGVVVDLEDAVHPSARGGARASLHTALGVHSSLLHALPENVPVVVRVNSVDSSDFEADLATVGPLLRAGTVHGIRIPKVESGAQVDAAFAQSRRFSDTPHLVALIESARGLARAQEIADARGVHSISLGESDLRADLGLPRGGGDDGLLLARLAIVQAARAAGLPSPVGSVHPSVTDLDGLRRSCEVLRELGFYGRSVIHPRQVPVVREAFAPRLEEVAWANEVLSRATDMEAAGSAAATLPDGSFVDPAILRLAEHIRQRAHA
ncbi:HpcH/HpaI aldolase/citrate lyase family protein [Knoellia sp. CPCC 206435]|uniref:HpcH/HpaI aldolase/citrate lyase family protein n=1 Tax=Knoellia terrae TaxID=3404797 RepID=UPI003B429444